MAKAKIKTTTSKTPVSGSTSATGIEKLIGILPKGDGPILFDKINYMIMGLGVVIILIGFALMAGGNNPDPAIFDAKEVYSFQRITLAPILVITGLIIEIFAVLKKPSKASE